VINGPWWQIAENPNLGPLTTPQQQPVDFSIWQAADGTWQLWSCIRGTNCGGFSAVPSLGGKGHHGVELDPDGNRDAGRSHAR
jgi:hypothetical protein